LPALASRGGKESVEFDQACDGIQGRGDWRLKMWVLPFGFLAPFGAFWRYLYLLVVPFGMFRHDRSRFDQRFKASK
jgi:hypothetical protein